MINKSKVQVQSSASWFCPRCNNGDDNLNMVFEIKSFIKQLDKITTAHRTGQKWNIDKRCVKCANKWIFSSDWTCQEHITHIETGDTIGYEKHTLVKDDES